MRILFEDYHYNKEAIPSLEEIAPIELKKGKIKLPYVGYYHDADEGTIFILPKVFIVDNKAFGRCIPEEIIDTSADNSLLSPQDKTFLFGVSAWLYQAIALFNARHTDNGITSSHSLAGLVGSRGEGDATLIDHILALLRFNKEHQNLFTYIAIIQHSGNNKIHWTKTIRQTQPLLHKGKPFYLNCKTKSKIINYDEELIVLFFSTLDYLARSYHFQVKKNLNYDTLKAHRVENLIDTGKGTRLLRKIRNKYFTDELVALWSLLYAFYEQAERVAQKKAYSERLLVRNFNIIFEDMIDTLIGENKLPKGLKEQKDGKIIDHIYRDKSLLEADDIYFIGDSKYYREGNEVGENSLYKQFTYAKNVVQYQIDILNGKKDGDPLSYRDEITEGYNPTPNFFVRGFVDPDDLSYSDSKLRNKGKVDCNDHFTNRLFDRDTLLVLTYDINFLYVLSAYVQSHGTSDSVNNFLRKRFRNDIVEAFEKTYDFYRLTPLNGLSNEGFVEKHFRKLIGKIYCTAEGMLLLALKKGEDSNKCILESLSLDVDRKNIRLAEIPNKK
ncbi:LlaJI family restriction endonuclease [Capnocytophaga canimorsus]|uniref:LlaJI family restriction endonuclease n=1 Tax=Capnocytophaga canimorsus TaxID=28188 RepID=UPI0037D4D999